jgi:hypothetical protein
MKKLLTEKLSPQIVKRAEEIKKEIIRTRRDNLVKKYGKDAEKVLQGIAIKQAKKELEGKPIESTPMKEDKLRELIQNALSKPLSEKKKPFPDLTGDGKVTKADILKGRGIELEEDLDLGHTDDEPGMLKADLYRIGKYAMELYQMMDQLDNRGEIDFPHWWQAKIIKAKDMIISAKHYLDFEIKEPEIDAMVNVASEEDVIDEKLKPSMGAGAYVDDFRKSDAPQFKSKSKKKKQKMAVAAYLSAKDKIKEAILANLNNK